MACLFGHKWNGCKCERCGETRDEQHDWNGVECKRCSKERSLENLNQKERADAAINNVQVAKMAIEKLTDQVELVCLKNSGGIFYV